MGLAERRVKFSQLVGQLLVYAHSRGYNLALDEGRVLEKRKSVGGKVFIDRIHMPGSLHYSGLAQDTILYDSNWEPVRMWSNEWADLGSHWESLDPECTWGGRFAQVDLNHFSLGEK